MTDTGPDSCRNSSTLNLNDDCRYACFRFRPRDLFWCDRRAFEGYGEPPTLVVQECYGAYRVSSLHTITKRLSPLCSPSRLTVSR